MPTEAELRALVRDLESARFSVQALDGKQEDTARLTLWLPCETVRRLWAYGKAIRDADGVPATAAGQTTLPLPGLAPATRARG